MGDRVEMAGRAFPWGYRKRHALRKHLGCSWAVRTPEVPSAALRYLEVRVASTDHDLAHRRDQKELYDRHPVWLRPPVTNMRRAVAAVDLRGIDRLAEAHCSACAHQVDFRGDSAHRDMDRRPLFAHAMVACPDQALAFKMARKEPRTFRCSKFIGNRPRRRGRERAPVERERERRSRPFCRSCP